MLKNEIEERSKQKVMHKISEFPKFVREFFINNESITYTTKKNYLVALKHYLVYIKDLYQLEDIKLITSFIFGNLSIENINEYISGLLLTNIENTTNTKINSIKGIYKFLYFNGIIEKDVMSQIIIQNRRTTNSIIKLEQLIFLLNSINNISNDNLRIRNLSIVTLIVDTGLSVQDITELNLSNFCEDKIVYKLNDNIVQYNLKPRTLKYLKEYLEITNRTPVRCSEGPLYLLQQEGRLSIDAIQNIFKKYGQDISASNFQAKVSVRVKETHNYILTVENKNIIE